MSNIKSAESLAQQVLQAKLAYYKGDPIMSDEEYDAIEDMLKNIDPGNPVLSLVGSTSTTNKFEHIAPMGSQRKVNSFEEFSDWLHKRHTGYVNASLKADGASISLIYDNGIFAQAITRGDGKIGEDVSACAIKMKGFVPTIEGFPNQKVAVRCEVVLKKPEWKIIDPLLSGNPRNIGTGIMMRNNTSGSELLSVVAFDFYTENPEFFETETQKLHFLQSTGFEVVPNVLCHDLKEAADYFEYCTKYRAQFPYWIDGVVYRVDNIKRQEEFGVTDNKPKGQVAWKFDSKGHETILKGITLNVGHTGAIVPVAQIEPVTIGGSVISNVTLVNFDEIKRLDVAIGDSVWVIKANDIIPKIVRVTHRPNTRHLIVPPVSCPFCSGPVGRKKTLDRSEGAFLLCLSEKCHKKAFGKIQKWINSTGIDGLGQSVLAALIDGLDMKDAADLYTLKDRIEEMAEVVINQENTIRLGLKRAHSIVQSIESKRVLPLEVFLGSLGIEGLGKRRAKMMMISVNPLLNTLQSWRSQKLLDHSFAAKCGVPNAGLVIAQGIEDCCETIDRLLSAGVVVQQDLADSTVTHTSNKVCVTGKPLLMTKKEYAVALQAIGFELVDDININTKFLVQCDPNSFSTKVQKANKWGIPILSEKQLQDKLALN